jgi:hypothetical protein
MEPEEMTVILHTGRALLTRTVILLLLVLISVTG